MRSGITKNAHDSAKAAERVHSSVAENRTHMKPQLNVIEPEDSGGIGPADFESQKNSRARLIFPRHVEDKRFNTRCDLPSSSDAKSFCCTSSSQKRSIALARRLASNVFADWRTSSSTGSESGVGRPGSKLARPSVHIPLRSVVRSRACTQRDHQSGQGSGRRSYHDLDPRLYQLAASVYQQHG